ncbi:LacI family DNA-binding transcriptional regulator [Rhodococcus sp. T2V]|uniref:LacI family DNA-binding transcriptional regulator n=1 Tax=Rhodococcus sp. T2V TaxID=3034164 RepID=UPI0023E2A4BA|nr:LacI family DNA-binding transcriptional regulator [Rhodococcus sp. T2V]MDF3313544.1 LacI family DNA-binding transcriptional regulator [Rhodococcus sp. T2V]
MTWTIHGEGHAVDSLDERPQSNRRPTMRDVAERVGVSRALVSMVFRDMPGVNAQTREKIKQAATEIGYRPDAAAQVLRRARSRNIGVLFTLQHAFDRELIEELYPAAARYGYHLILGAMMPSRDEFAAVEELLSYHCEALILLGPDLDPKRLDELAAKLPVVEVSRPVRREQVDVIRSADGRGMRQAVDHLVELGHRSIVHVDGGRMPGAVERRKGYRAGMRKHGLDEHIRVIAGDYTEESGAAAARELLAEQTPPTAVIAGNDRCALGLLDSFRRGGLRVPEDISVVGYDDSRLARLSFVDLTSVRQDVEQMADCALRAAIERLDEGRTQMVDIVLPPTLIVRGTSGPPPQRRPVDVAG